MLSVVAGVVKVMLNTAPCWPKSVVCFRFLSAIQFEVVSFMDKFNQRLLSIGKTVGPVHMEYKVLLSTNYVSVLVAQDCKASYLADRDCRIGAECGQLWSGVSCWSGVHTKLCVNMVVWRKWYDQVGWWEANRPRVETQQAKVSARSGSWIALVSEQLSSATTAIWNSISFLLSFYKSFLTDSGSFPFLDFYSMLGAEIWPNLIFKQNRPSYCHQKMKSLKKRWKDPLKRRLNFSDAKYYRIPLTLSIGDPVC